MTPIFAMVFFGFQLISTPKSFIECFIPTLSYVQHIPTKFHSNNRDFWKYIYIFPLYLSSSPSELPISSELKYRTKIPLCTYKLICTNIFSWLITECGSFWFLVHWCTFADSSQPHIHFELYSWNQCVHVRCYMILFLFGSLLFTLNYSDQF